MTSLLVNNKPTKIVHAAEIHVRGEGKVYLLLRESAPFHYVWFAEKGDTEEETAVMAPTIPDALIFARRQWKHQSFRTVICGFRYTLPERDEHGSNALFHQMAASYSSSGKVYFDEELGSNCVVFHASEEALALWHRLQKAGRA